MDDKAVEKAIRDLQRGSAEAFQLLYQKYNQKIYRFCLRMLNDPSIADDAFQETFIKVFENRLNFRGDNFTSWIFTIARHTCLNVIRQKKEFDTIEEDFDITSTNYDEDVAVQDIIQKAVSELPVSLREALILREYEDCSYQEIAEILDIDLSLAKVRIHRARLILRKVLQPLVKEIYEH